METTMTAAIVDAQGPGIADRIKTCARASTPKKARPGEWRRMIADRGAPGGAGPEDPRGAWVQPRCQEWRHARAESTRWWQAKAATTVSTWSGPTEAPAWSHKIDASP